MTRKDRFFRKVEARTQELLRLVDALHIAAGRSAATGETGEHAIARAGTGREFWQYREAEAGEARDRIDWRRSARDDTLYVRETEKEMRHELVLWCDCRPNMLPPDDRHKKAHQALAMACALAAAARDAHERVSCLGQPGAITDLSLARFHDAGQSWPTQASPGPHPGQIVIISDFFEPVDVWKLRLQGLTHGKKSLVLVCIRDRSELDFAFRGRVRFHDALSQDDREAGRAEYWKRNFHALLTRHDEELSDFARAAGIRRLEHVTDGNEGAFFIRLAEAISGPQS